MTYCYVCPHRCGVDRPETIDDPGLPTWEKCYGSCGMPMKPVVARAGLHMWEEPVISGTKGSGTVFFTGCNYDVENDISNGKIVFSISSVVTESSVSASRTAIPASVNWSEYKYTLKAIEGFGSSGAKTETTLYTDKDYSGLNEAIQLNAANYKFTLTAYKGAEPVLAGSTTVDLSSGSGSASFIMYGVSGSTGTATITLHVPDDDVIKTIKAGWTTNPTVDFENTTNSKEITLVKKIRKKMKKLQKL